ncbi:hypothetical protein DEM27_28640 [Metarhizobium album]|uniref:Uncharacterized protein n=1 Tax=Metarhizobium album TaxID=2182425 RepID=A0A2U2DHM1_9HYPH|nr:hypothetical protein [Rhizobium album]PWE52774.1 hypothetical protein DEM27_28640 [Rhizobium album]
MEDKPTLPAPVLMHRAEVINIKVAVHRSGRSERTIRDWCRIYGIGRQSAQNAPLEISAPALEMVLHGEYDILELLRRGQRDHASVRRYFDHLGLPK